MARHALALLALAMLVALAVVSLASGVESDTSSTEPKQRRPSAASERWHRLENVPFITASPVKSGRNLRKAAPGTTVIEYDNNVAVRRLGNTGTVVVGNQFNVGGGGNPISGPWTITGFVVQNAGPAFPPASTNATVVFFGGPGVGTQAPVLGVVSSVTLTGGLQTFTLPTPLTGTGSFLGGVVNSTYTACTVTSVPPATTCDGVALDTVQNSTNPLGFHAMSIAAFVIPGTGFATLGNQNAIFKVLGSALPVELMSFDVEAE